MPAVVDVPDAAASDWKGCRCRYAETAAMPLIRQPGDPAQTSVMRRHNPIVRRSFRTPASRDEEHWEARGGVVLGRFRAWLERRRGPR